MKLQGKHVERDGSGYVRLICEHPEDMWHLYNLMAKGDQLKSSTERRVRLDSSTGSAESARFKLTITVSITEIEFDVSTCKLRVNGKNLTENKYIKLGAFHTIDLELNQVFTLIKEHWDSIDFERINQACDITKNAEVGAIVLQEGLANICLVTSHMTVLRQRLEVPVPRKRKGSVTNYEKGVVKFFDQVYQAMLRHFDLDILKVVIIAGPGFIKDQFLTYAFDQAIKTECKSLISNKYKFLSIHSSSGHKHSLQEAMLDPTVKSKLIDTKAHKETLALEQFYQMLDSQPDRAFYGPNHVKLANQTGAINTLLITDELFRAADIKTRRHYTKMVEQVRHNGGNALIFSSLHVSGEQLTQLSGIAAILKFPMPDIEYMDLD